MFNGKKDQDINWHMNFRSMLSQSIQPKKIGKYENNKITFEEIVYSVI